jgi:hypothetical protein
MYLRDMGIDQELLDIVEKNSEARRQVEMPPSEWVRLRIVTESSL